MKGYQVIFHKLRNDSNELVSYFESLLEISLTGKEMDVEGINKHIEKSKETFDRHYKEFLQLTNKAKGK